MTECPRCHAYVLPNSAYCDACGLKLPQAGANSASTSVAIDLHEATTPSSSQVAGGFQGYPAPSIPSQGPQHDILSQQTFGAPPAKSTSTFNRLANMLFGKAPVDIPTPNSGQTATPAVQQSPAASVPSVQPAPVTPVPSPSGLPVVPPHFQPSTVAVPSAPVQLPPAVPTKYLPQQGLTSAADSTPVHTTTASAVPPTPPSGQPHMQEQTLPTVEPLNIVAPNVSAVPTAPTSAAQTDGPSYQVDGAQPANAFPHNSSDQVGDSFSGAARSNGRLLPSLEKVIPGGRAALPKSSQILGPKAIQEGNQQAPESNPGFFQSLLLRWRSRLETPGKTHFERISKTAEPEEETTEYGVSSVPAPIVKEGKPKGRGKEILNKCIAALLGIGVLALCIYILFKKLTVSTLKVFGFPVA